MKHRYLILTVLFFGVVSLIIFDASNNEANSHTNGAPATRTGSPGDGGATCKNCHAGPTPATQAGMITSNIPAAGYSGGQTYTITATVNGNGHTKFGFEISPQNVAGTQLGTLIVTNTTEMQLVGSGKYITQKTAGCTGTNSRTWIFDWTAPAAGTGNVTFYGAFNITNAANNSSGDTTVLSTLTVSECTPPTQPGAISGPAVICSMGGVATYYINPVPGATDYNWTAPVGSTILSTPGDSATIQWGPTFGTITVTATNACGTSAATSLVVSLDAFSLTASSTNISCNGGNNGTATAIPVSGIVPYTYSWSAGQTTSTISNLATGTYTVTVTDGAGCTNSSSATITEPSAISLNASAVTSHCGNADGSASVISTGGTPGYTYSWNSVPVQTTSTAANLVAGNYIVTVTDLHSCTASASATVGTIAGPAANAVNIADVRCHDGNDGQAEVQVTGGTGPFSYQWTPSGGTDSTANNLQAGAYTVTVTDAFGCTATSGVTINEPTAISLNMTATDAGCGQSNGSAAVVASGGMGNFSYQWNTVPVQTTSTATNLPAASYTVTVTDTNGCSENGTIGVSNTSGPTLAPGIVTDVTCFDGNDGALSVIVSTGTGPFTYSWSPSGGTDTLAGNLQAGTYSVTVTDSMGCISVLSATVNQPPALIADAGINTSVCIGTSLTLGTSPVASGGTPGYTYLWSPAADLSSATDSTPVTTPASTTPYQLIITDAHGCADSSSITVTVNPLPGVPAISIAGDTLTSTSAFSYQWYLDGNILNGITNEWIIPGQEGIYTVVITDANGCSATSAGFFYSTAVGENFLQPFSVDISPNPVTNYITVESRLLSGSGNEISIYNLVGEKITFQLQSVKPGMAILNVSKLPSAFYLLEISSGDKMLRGKFVKE